MTGVVVQFRTDGLEEANKSLGDFNTKLKASGEAANDAQRKGFTKLNRALEDTSRKLSSTGTRMISFGKSAAIGITLPLVAAGGMLVKMAADAVESENLFEVAMGDMADDARDFSVLLRKELGLNEFEVRKQIGTLFMMTESMGLSKDAALTMSKSLALLGQDMASIFNLKPEEAFQKIQAGLTGEVEPLKRLGIIVNETTIKQTAMTAGLIKQGQIMTEGQKVMARYLTIVNATKGAQGDLARTLDSPTNRMRILTGEMKQQAIVMGTALLPIFNTFLGSVVQPFLEWTNDMIVGFTELAPATQKIVIGFAILAGVVPPLVIGLGALFKITGFLLGATGLSGLLKLFTGGSLVAAGIAMKGFMITMGAVVGPLIASFVTAFVAARTFINFMKGDHDISFAGALNETRKDIEGFATFAKEKVFSLFGDDAGIEGQAQKGVEDFSEVVRRQMEKSSNEIKKLFGETGESLDKLEVKQIKFEQKRDQLLQKRVQVNRTVLESVTNMHDAFAEDQIRDIQRTEEFNIQAQRRQLEAARVHFSTLGEEGAAAVNRIDVELEKLDDQLRNQTFGSGAKQALQEYINKASDLGSVARNVIGTAFKNLEQIIADFILTGKLGFGEFIDVMKRALAEFLASQIVKAFAGWILKLITSLKSAGGLLGTIATKLSTVLALPTTVPASGGTGGTSTTPTTGGTSGGQTGGSTGGSGVPHIPSGGPTLPKGLPGKFGGADLSALMQGAAAGFVGNALSGKLFGEGIGTDIGSGIGGAIGFGFGGPIGAGIGSFIGGSIGSLFNDKDYPYARADFTAPSNKPAARSFSAELDNGPLQEIEFMADQASQAVNNVLLNLGLQNEHAWARASIGFASGRSGSNLGKGFFAGVGGSFASGSTFTGLESPADAVEKAAEVMLGKMPKAREALAAEGINIRAYATGGEGVFTQPTLMMVGERPEKVSISHLSGAGGGGEGVTVVLNGPNILDDITSVQFARTIDREISKRSRRGF